MNFKLKYINKLLQLLFIGHKDVVKKLSNYNTLLDAYLYTDGKDLEINTKIDKFINNCCD